MESSVANTIKSNVVKLTVTCQRCSLRGVCEPINLPTSEQARLDAIIERRRPISRGEYLYRSGEPFRSVFCVKAGSIKTYATTDKGEEQVTGFHLPGEMVGLEGIAMGINTTDAVALETSSVCEIPYERLQEISADVPYLLQQIILLTSQEVMHGQTLTMLISKKSAEERLAALLLSLSDRFAHRGFSPTDFHLSMSRHDIGNFLGMAVETVSRVFTRFDNEGLISVRRKHIQLCDLPRLRELAGSAKIPSPLQAHF